MAIAAYRLSDIRDPEERLEDAALWKAMCDEYGDDLITVTKPEPGLPLFGRRHRRENVPGCPVFSDIDYWNDLAFLARCERSFGEYEFKSAKTEVERLHSEGFDAFLKSTRAKHSLITIPLGTSFSEGMGDMAYSFMDGGPTLLVQQRCTFTCEHRFFVVDQKIVSHSPIQTGLTPIDRIPAGATFETPHSTAMHVDEGIVNALRAVAEDTALKMERDHAVVDCALINGVPGIVEFNPMALGQVGLYAADVRALARASRSLAKVMAPFPESRDEDETWKP